MTEKLPVIARLYHTGSAARRYRRASVLPGPGEPLTLVATAEDRIRPLEDLLRRLVMLHERHSLAPQHGHGAIEEAYDERDDIMETARALINWEGSRRDV